MKTNIFSKLQSTVIVIAVILFSCNQKPAENAEDKTMEKKDSVEGMTTPETSGASISLAELMAGKEKYNGQTVIVKGTVTKMNVNIMGLNWIHISDGTVADGDITVTTTDTATVGEQVAFEGVLTLDKDFGSGYRYDFIVEKGRKL